MANVTLYKDGKTMEKSEGGAGYYVKNYGWSLDAPTTTPTTATTPKTTAPTTTAYNPQGNLSAAKSKSWKMGANGMSEYEFNFK